MKSRPSGLIELEAEQASAAREEYIRMHFGMNGMKKIGGATKSYC